MIELLVGGMPPSTISEQLVFFLETSIVLQAIVGTVQREQVILLVLYVKAVCSGRRTTEHFVQSVS